ncbi:MAG: PrpF domain-containing protein, partial [Verrucomicrobiales bacterium]
GWKEWDLMAQEAFRVVLMRGGSSRALFFRSEDLPRGIEDQDRIFLAALGCPDRTGRQVDGLGGSASSNNKVAIISPSNDPDVDVNFTFAQLSPDHGAVDRSGSCGNISAAVGAYAVEEQMVLTAPGVTLVRIRNTNSDKIVIAHVPNPDGQFQPEGSFAIAGVLGSGARIDLEFIDPAGSAGRGLLPTGRPRDVLLGADFAVSCSLVDAGKPGVLVPFAELGLEPNVDPKAVDADQELLNRIEAVRALAAVKMGLVPVPPAAGTTAPAVPQLTFFARGGEGSIRALGISMGKAHRTLPLTAAICLTAAASTPGSLVSEALGEMRALDQPLKLSHPAGEIETTLSLQTEEKVSEIRSVSVARTARRILEGTVFVARGD